MKIQGHTHNLREIAEKLAEKLKTESTSISVWRESTYAAEINGPWNVVISISFLKENNAADADADIAAEKSPERVTCMYMVRRCVYYEETYFCPFFKTSRYQESELAAHPTMMGKVTESIRYLYPEATMITGFPTHDIVGKP